MTSFMSVALSAIRESTTNPRRTFDEAAMRDLVESVREHGVLQPVLLRRRGERFEIVAGARRFRAAQAAGLQEIPAVVRELDDRAALEVQVIENLQRSDLEPLEEARGYKTLLDQHGYEVGQLSAALGKSTSYVYGRLRLLDLPEEVLQLIQDGLLPISHALLLGRIQDPQQQIDAAVRIGAEAGDDDWRAGAMPLAAARKVIENEFLLRLEKAPFDLDDATLCPAAGACATCPKRTRNQTTLFDVPTEHDLCTDAKCFDEKVEAAWQRNREQAITDGIPVHQDDAPLDGLVDPTEKCWDVEPRDDSGQPRYDELLGDELAKMPKVLVRRGGRGAGKLWVRQADVDAALRRLGYDDTPEAKPAKPAAAAARRDRDELKRTKDHQRRLAVAAAVVQTLREGTLEVTQRAVIELALVAVAWPKPARLEVGKLFGIDLAEKWVNDQMAVAPETAEWIKKAKSHDLLALLLTLLAWGVSGPSDQWDGSYTDSFLRVTEWLEIDVQAIDRSLDDKGKKTGKAKGTKAAKAKAGAQ